jgi:hypothetical protein
MCWRSVILLLVAGEGLLILVVLGRWARLLVVVVVVVSRLGVLAVATARRVLVLWRITAVSWSWGVWWVLVVVICGCVWI